MEKEKKVKRMQRGKEREKHAEMRKKEEMIKNRKRKRG
jgi:hypothetical protein